MDDHKATNLLAAADAMLEAYAAAQLLPSTHYENCHERHPMCLIARLSRTLARPQQELAEARIERDALLWDATRYRWPREQHGQVSCLPKLGCEAEILVGQGKGLDDAVDSKVKNSGVTQTTIPPVAIGFN